MVPPPFPEKKLFTVSRPETPRAVDGTGRDRTEEIARQDGVYLSGFVPTRFQGIVEPHELVLELPRARDARRVMLYLTGWIFYADTSINVSLSQGERAERAAPPVLEVPDGKGGWKTALPAMGYPAGKTKTMPIDLSAVLDRNDPRVRIRTNLEIYWDRIAYTVDEDDAPLDGHAAFRSPRRASSSAASRRACASRPTGRTSSSTTRWTRRRAGPTWRASTRGRATCGTSCPRPTTATSS